MPFKDPERKRKYDRDWNERRIADGYGKALYARRKERFEAEQALRDALWQLSTQLQDAIQIADREPNGDHSRTERQLDQLRSLLREAQQVVIDVFEQHPTVTDTPMHYMPKDVDG